MTGAVFVETLQRGWKGMLGWGLGLGLLAFISIIIIPDVDALEQMASLMESLPPVLIQALGGGDITFMATPEGYLALQYFSVALLFFSIYAVVSGLDVTANDEDRGILDAFLSLPLARWRLILEKFAAYSLLIGGAILISFVFMGAAIGLTPALATVSMDRLAAANFVMLPALLVVLAFTLFIAAIVRRRGLAIALAAIFVVASYFMDTIGRTAPDTVVSALRSVSFFAYYDATGILQNGLVWGNVLLLLVAAVVLVAGGMWFFERRDVGL
jgi:ABC-type transport system involved in multi-copper enzyme maturation permease subunit